MTVIPPGAGEALPPPKAGLSAPVAPLPAPTAATPRVMLWMLMIIYIFNFLDRQIVSILAEPIKRDFGLSDTQLGLMTGLAFALFYTLMGIPIARYADRSSTNRVALIAWSVAIWSAMTMACGAARTFPQLREGQRRGGRVLAHRLQVPVELPAGKVWRREGRSSRIYFSIFFCKRSRAVSLGAC